MPLESFGRPKRSGKAARAKLGKVRKPAIYVVRPVAGLAQRRGVFQATTAVLYPHHLASLPLVSQSLLFSARPRVVLTLKP